jgi:hypothetical protein
VLDSCSLTPPLSPQRLNTSHRYSSGPCRYPSCWEPFCCDYLQMWLSVMHQQPFRCMGQGMVVVMDEVQVCWQPCQRLLPLPATWLLQVDAGLHELLDSPHTNRVLVMVDLWGHSQYMHKVSAECQEQCAELSRIEQLVGL